MAEIKPFTGYIPSQKFAKDVASLPYDVMSASEGKTLIKDNPISYLRVEKSEVDFSEDVDPHGEEVHKKGGVNLKKLIDDGILVKAGTPSYYIYRQKMGQIVQTGLVAGASVDEYNKGIIKKHELTRKDKEDDRTYHVDRVGANTGPVFLAYPQNKTIDALFQEITSKKPDIDFTADDGIAHTLWVVGDKEVVDKITALFRKIPAMYIADGHHRSAAASRVQSMRKARNPGHDGTEPYNYFLSVIFADNQLNIMDYNRVVKDLHGLTPDKFIVKLKGKFDVREMKVSSPEDAKPRRRAEFSMYLEGKWYKLKPKASVFPKNDPVKSLDVSILQDNVLAPILGIDDPRTSKRIDFIGGIRGMKELVRRCGEDCKVAFAIYPTGMDQLMNIADAGQIMPPKSTWFEPKLRSGMITRMLD